MKNTLKFNNGNFRIMLVGDPHENPDLSTETAKNKRADYIDLQTAALKKLKPDLVVLMGDNARGASPDELQKTLEEITLPYKESKTPFTFVLGNHDLECEVSDLSVQYDIYRQLPYCVMPEENDVNRYGDFNLTVLSSDEKNILLNLWLIYSGNHADKKYHSNYAFVSDEQIRLYEEKALALKEKCGSIVPAVLFQHIPVPEEYELLKEVSFLSLLADGVAGLNGKKGKYFVKNRKTDVKGYMGEAPCSPDYNNGQFASWKKIGDIKAAFFGHDHLNDFTGTVDGILLGQCKLSGFRQYGDGLMQGVRIVDINEECPGEVNTRMYYYRELIGNHCRSIHGSLRIFRDRTSVKIETSLKAAGIAAAVLSPVIVSSVIMNIKGKK